MRGTDTQIRLLLKQLYKARDEVARAQMMLAAVEAEGNEDLEDMVNELAAIILGREGGRGGRGRRGRRALTAAAAGDVKGEVDGLERAEPAAHLPRVRPRDHLRPR
jgi:hypothetical protein